MTVARFPQDVVITTRGPCTENTHLIHAVVTDTDGKILYTLSNPHRQTLIRSCAKPVQALAVLEATASDSSITFTEQDVALMCASHNGEHKHVQLARSILTRADIPESALRCGGHPSLLHRINEERTRAGVTPSAVESNCSGKHAAMLVASKTINTPLEGYHELHHPMQQRVKRIVEELAGVGEDEVQWAIDGCNMAAPAYSLDLMSKTFARFAKAADDVEKASEKVSDREKHMARIYHAMTTHADLVAGETRYCTEMMYAYKGAMIGKIGAEACYGIGVRDSEQTRKIGAKGALGIAAKVEDGNLQILYAALEEILKQLGLVTPEAREEMKRWHYPRLANTMNVVTGKVEFHFKMRHAGESND